MKFVAAGTLAIIVTMTGPFADRLFRIAFALAGCYNLAFGLWAAVWPLAFFELFDMPPPRYPGIWACLGMVVGVYGLLYLHAAWKLQTAKPIIAIGLLGKLLGPMGMLMTFSDDWPRRLGIICLYNDLIWWLPFGLFLARGTAIGRQLVRFAPWLSITLHTIALVALAVILRHGAATEPDLAARARYVAENAAAWSLGWCAWMMAAMSLVGFYAWWGGRLVSSTGRRPVTPVPHSAGRWRVTSVLHRPVARATAVSIAAAGLVFDFTGEGLMILLLVERAATSDLAAFTDVERMFTLLSAGAANGLYTMAGILLTLATPDLPGWVRTAMWGTWVAGGAMTIAGLMNHVGGMVISTALLFPLLLLWTAWMGARWG